MRRNLYNVNVLTGKQLREARENRGWTQAKLAEELGLDPEKGGKLVSSWEHSEEVPRLRETDLRRLLFPQGQDNELSSYSTARLAAEVGAMVAELVRRIDLLENRLGDTGFTTYTQDDPPAADLRDDIYPVPDEPTAGWGTGPDLK